MRPSTVALFVALLGGAEAWTIAPGHGLSMPRHGLSHQRHYEASHIRRASAPQANFFNQAKEMMAYKMKHVGTMATVQHVVVGTFDELNKVEAEVKEAGSTTEAMADAARKHSLDTASVKLEGDASGTVGPFMLGQKEFAFEKVCFEGDDTQLLPCRSSAGFHLIKVLRRGTAGPDGKLIDKA
jgi:parvulin-like peptidyl-prolyl isomerase